MSSKSNLKIKAIKVKQWLKEWDDVKFDPRSYQKKPEPFFYIFSMPAGHLKALTGVYRRSIKKGVPRAKDPNVQRGHQEERSRTIREFVRFGFPWCEMGNAKRRRSGSEDLRKPGWLPTAIIVNILSKDSVRNGKHIPQEDLITVEDKEEMTILHLPSNFSGSKWEPNLVYPMEVIDGQHRLWAFEEFDPCYDFELPIVAFHNLDRSWQAYLFWSINITPKRINKSLAFDLYPLLRQEDWLDRFAGHSIYRETRCQELVESLWSNTNSPWYQRINMLGETKRQRGSYIPMVSQAAWIRSLMASFVKEWRDSSNSIGGLFGAPRALDEPFLPWNRAMQAAFLIFAGNSLKISIKNTRSTWAESLRKDGRVSNQNGDPAFYGEYSLLTTDQGIRGFLQTINDICYIKSQDIELYNWKAEEIFDTKRNRKIPATDDEYVDVASKSLKGIKCATFIDMICRGLSSYDWRTSSTPRLSDEERLKQSVFRGSSGYREMRRQLILHLKRAEDEVSNAAEKVANILNF